MRHCTLWLAPFLFMTATITHANHPSDSFDKEAQKLLASHFQQYKNLEYFSGITLSVSIPNQKIRNYYIGTVSREENSPPINSQTLFQIGSITKSFTAAIFLQLEKEKRLQLSDTLPIHLPEYKKWSAVNLAELLNMTSGIPNYTDTPRLNAEEANHLAKVWTKPDIIQFVYPKDPFSPPLKTGYFYSNTGYILAEMIAEKMTKHAFKEELENRLIKPANLTNTFYPVPTYNPSLLPRLAHGYNYNQYDNPDLVGKDIIENNLSWAGAAGAMISTSEDIIKWIKNLFIDEKILDAAQKHKLTEIVSTTSGKPIIKTSEKDPQGFGLGVAEIYNKEHPLESMWFYEGETLGFRAIYIYAPCNKIIISSIFNSATNAENDHSKDLMKNAYELVIKNYPHLRCH